MEYGYVTGKPQLGISCQDVNETISKMYNLPVGVYITAVTEGSAAEKAGLQSGDVIIKVDGEEVKTYGTDPLNPDNNTLHESGYTMLEMYLDYAMTHREPMDDGYTPSEEGIQNTAHSTQAQKIIREGQIYIQRGSKTYTLEGQVIEVSK